MCDQPFFSIIMPVYNVEKYIDEAILSVLNQTFTDFELIIVDDGTKDKSAEICDNYKQRDERIKVVHQSNKGRLLARRRGIDLSTGKYIVSVDPDDKCDIHLLETLNQFITKYHPDVLVYGWFEFDNNNHILSTKRLYNSSIRKFSKQEFINEFIEHDELNNMWVKTVTREVIGIGEDYSNFGKINFAEDKLITAAVIEKADVFYWVDKPLYYYRINQEGINRNFGPQHAIDSTRVNRKIFEMIENCHAGDQTKNKFINKYFRIINTYVLKSGRIIKTEDAFFSFRKKLREEEFPNIIKDASYVNRILYKIGNSKKYLLIKFLGYLGYIYATIKKLK